MTSIPSLQPSEIRRPPVPAILDLEQMDDNVFRGLAHVVTPRIYGGQALGQSLVAAGRTVPTDRSVHSLHAHFLRPGSSDHPIDYHVERVRDGGSFTTRSVEAIQDGKLILVATASFQRPENGLEHQDLFSDPAIPPEQLPRLEDSVSAADLNGMYSWLPTMLKKIGVEFRFPETYPRLANLRGETRPPLQRAWIRTPQPLDNDALVQAAGFAYSSDLFLLSAALPPHGRTVESPGVQVASLDHTVWFHRPFRSDEWHLYEQHGYQMGGGRGTSRGSLFDRKGILVASTAQEGLLRLRE
jgi:acyl-CoA thioesterase-2